MALTLSDIGGVTVLLHSLIPSDGIVVSLGHRQTFGLHENMFT